MDQSFETKKLSHNSSKGHSDLFPHKFLNTNGQPYNLDMVVPGDYQMRRIDVLDKLNQEAYLNFNLKIHQY